MVLFRVYVYVNLPDGKHHRPLGGASRCRFALGGVQQDGSELAGEPRPQLLGLSADRSKPIGLGDFQPAILGVQIKASWFPSKLSRVGQ